MIWRGVSTKTKNIVVHRDLETSGRGKKKNTQIEARITSNLQGKKWRTIWDIERRLHKRRAFAQSHRSRIDVKPRSEAIRVQNSRTHLTRRRTRTDLLTFAVFNNNTQNDKIIIIFNRECQRLPINRCNCRLVNWRSTSQVIPPAPHWQRRWYSAGIGGWSDEQDDRRTTTHRRPVRQIVP